MSEVVLTVLPAAILAGGLATRLRPATETIPKALIDIHGEPFLGHQLRLLRERGITDIVLCVGYRGEQIREYAGNGDQFGLRIEYSFDGPQLLGTAGAIRKALPLLGGACFVLYGDSYLPCDYQAVEQHFLAGGRLGLMTVFHNHGKWDTSNIELRDGRILAYEKVHRTPRMQHIDYGLGVLDAKAFESVAEDQPHDLATVYQNLLRNNQLAAYEVPTRFYEVGSFDGIRELEEFLSR